MNSTSIITCIANRQSCSSDDLACIDSIAGISLQRIDSDERPDLVFSQHGIALAFFKASSITPAIVTRIKKASQCHHNTTVFLPHQHADLFTEYLSHTASLLNASVIVIPQGIPFAQHAVSCAQSMLSQHPQSSTQPAPNKIIAQAIRLAINHGSEHHNQEQLVQHYTTVLMQNIGSLHEISRAPVHRLASAMNNTQHALAVFNIFSAPIKTESTTTA